MSEVINAEEQQSSTKLIAVMDQFANAPAESPVLAKSKQPVVHSSTQGFGVAIKEVAFKGHLLLRGDSSKPDFVKGVSEVLGISLPTMPLSSSASKDVALCWISPDEWLILCELEKAYEIEVKLRNALIGHFAIINQSGGQTIFELSGDQVLKVLKKSTPLDVHPNEFPVGKVATSVLAKSSALVYRAADQRWQLVVRRSFADYLWQWLLDAGKEYGILIEKS